MASSSGDGERWEDDVSIDVAGATVDSSGNVSMQIGAVDEALEEGAANGNVHHEGSEDSGEWDSPEEINAIKGNTGWQGGGGWQRQKGKRN